MKRNNYSLIEIKQRFSKHLSTLENISVDDFEAMNDFIVELGEYIMTYTEKSKQTEEEQQYIQSLSESLSSFIDQLYRVQFVLSQREWQNIEQYYESLKLQSQNGNMDAKKSLKEFEPVYLQTKCKIKAQKDVMLPYNLLTHISP